MNALSSTTSTVVRPSELFDRMPDGPHVHRTVGHIKPHRPAGLATHRFPNDGDAGASQAEPAGDDIALADVNGPRLEEISEHARASNEARRHAAGIRAALPHLRHGVGYGRIRGPTGMGRMLGERACGEEDVRQRPDLRGLVVQDDRYAAAKAQRGEGTGPARNGDLTHPHQPLVGYRGHGRR